MAEDYTYTTVMDWRKRAHELAGNVLDLESAAKKQREHVAELAHQLAQADSNMVALAARNAELAARLQELERENAELKRRCTHMERRLRSMLIDAIVDDGDPNTLTLDWGQLNEAQPADDTDAPLTLAAIDEDGDE